MFNENAMRSVLARFAGYTLVIFLFAALLPSFVRSGGTWIFEEGGPIEWTQLSLLIATAGVFAAGRYAAAGSNSHARIGGVCAAALALAVIRELDAFFDRVIPYAGWQLPAAIVLVLGAYIAVCERSSLCQALPAFFHTRAFGVLWAGFILAIPLAQLIGHGEFLTAVMGTDYEHDYKRIIEESMEMAGYLVILIGAVETAVDRRGP